MKRRCEQCHQLTSGFLRMTKRLDGVLVQACEDCALDLEREKDEAAKADDADLLPVPAQRGQR